MARSLSEFTLDSATFEVRYDFATLLWDRAGAMWTEARREWPQLRPIAAEPNKTVFRSGDHYELSVTADRANITAAFPDSQLSDFNKMASSFLAIVLAHLSIGEFTRIGFRVVYAKEYDTIESASADMLSLTGLNLKARSFFGIEGALSKPEIGVRWEGKAAGVFVRAKADERKLTLELPFGVRVPKVENVTERNVLVLDLNYYTIGAVPVGTLRVTEWVEQVHRLLRRDALSFIGVGR